MENKSQSVEVVTEPKIETRFGFVKNSKALSSVAAKVWAGAAIVLIFGVMVFKDAPPPAADATAGIKPPENSGLGDAYSAHDFDSYSEAQENERLKNKGRKRGKIVQLPGLQKIERQHVTEIPPGSMMRATLVTGASNGTVKAAVKESLIIRGITLIPSGAVLIGTGQSSEDRLYILFSKLVRKDGTTQDITAQAADTDDQTVGLKGRSKFAKYALKYGTAVGLNFVGGMTEGLQERNIVGDQVVTKPSAKNALLNGASRATYEMANETMTDLRNKPPTIEVKAGKEILIIFGDN